LFEFGALLFEFRALLLQIALDAHQRQQGVQKLL
jgi:hypothetical protein